MNISEEDLQRINELITYVAPEDMCQTIERMGGLTNRTYKVSTNQGKAYVVRIPGEGTEDMIRRSDEKISTLLACELGIDANLLFWRDYDGAKVTEYIQGAVTLNRDQLKLPEIIRNVAVVFKKLHSCNVDTGVRFDVFDMADTYERVIKAHDVEMYPDYEEIRRIIMDIRKQSEDISSACIVPCHNDPLPENWIYGKDQLYLIDWEYAGMNDSMWDLADVSIESDYNDTDDENLLTEYLGVEPSIADKTRFMANKLYVDYLWTLWGKARVPFDGAEMEAYALGRYQRLKNNLQKYEAMIELL